MIIHNISNFKNFFQSLDQSGQDLTLITPDGNSYDWKNNRSFLFLLLQTLDMEKYNKIELKPCITSENSRLICCILNTKE